MIGSATVRHLVAADADVIASGRSTEALEKVAADTGARVLPFDLTSEDSVRDVLDSLDVWG
ncbi:MAG TPA: SDR family NAD(P)-dependent oxidoreductase, partial [Propionibacteriaceae bacterium]